MRVLKQMGLQLELFVVHKGEGIHFYAVYFIYFYFRECVGTIALMFHGEKKSLLCAWLIRADKSWQLLDCVWM